MPWLTAVVSAFVIAFAAVALWWWVPRWQVDRRRLKIRDPKARADIEDKFRKTIGQLLGGAAVLVGAGLAYYQTQRTLQVSNEQSLRSLEASRDLLISQQVSKGFEDLGSDKMMVRLGGIYALEGVMNTSSQYRQPVLEALCAFILESTTETHIGQESPGADIQATLTVIGRRTPVFVNWGNLRIKGPSGPVDLAGARIPKAVLRQADLSYADMRAADLSGADLRGADLMSIDLSGANLSYADMRVANLSGADLRGADLSDANLSDEDLIDIKHTDLKQFGAGAKLLAADLTHANLGHARLSHADLSYAKVSQNQLNEACGTGTKLPSGLTIKPCVPPVALPR